MKKDSQTKKTRSKSILKSVLIVCLGLLALFAILSLFVSYYVISSTREDVRTISQIEEDGIRADTIVVLGASVYPNGNPSDILADRLEVAADLYFAGVAPTIIVSGDNRTSHYNESDAMKAYCVHLGVPEEAVFVDHAGYDTYASMYRAHFVYGANRAFIVTQAYHLYRALAIADTLGMRSYGVAADKGAYDNQTMYSLREIFARNKDMLLAILSLPPEDATSAIDN